MNATAKNRSSTTALLSAVMAAVAFFCRFAASFGGTEPNQPSLACGVTRHCSSIVSNNGVLVRLNAGRLQTSVNAEMWVECRLATITFLRALTYANGIFVAVGGSYFDEPGVVVTSRDGVHWTQRNPPGKVNLYGVAFGNGTFVAVGDAGTILTSPDGVNWKRRDSKSTDALLGAVAFGNSRFVIGGESGTVLTSTNGLDWTLGHLGTPVYIGAITFGRGTFVVAIAGMTFESTDGTLWNRRPLAALRGSTSSH